MKIDRESQVMYGVHLLLGVDDYSRGHDKQELSNALGISSNTLDLYLAHLSKRDLINRKKSRYQKEIRQIIKLTEEGAKEVQKIESDINKLLLTNERHNIPNCINVTDILSRIPDPLAKIFFLAVYNKYKSFDLPMFLETLRISKQDVNIINLFPGSEGSYSDTGRIPLIESIFKTCFYGDIDCEILDTDVWGEKDIDAFLVVAEARLKQGKLKDAEMIYDYILSPKLEITQNQWFIARLGMVNILRRQGKFDEALEQLDEIHDMVDDSVYQAFIKENKALIYTITYQNQKSMDMFKRSIASFTTHGLPLMLSIAYNNRGTCYFRMEDYQNAEKDWIKARKFAKKAQSAYCEAAILCNLSDTTAMKGKIDLAVKYLNKAFKIFKEIPDYEGMASVYYNFSLLYLESGQLENALENFRNSITVAEPLPSDFEKKDWRKTFIQRGKDHGFDSIENII
ncbi:MAG: tetratricopeptide repeat protein [Thermoplasmatota archaeon]